jgi:hypothetical protein
MVAPVILVMLETLVITVAVAVAVLVVQHDVWGGTVQVILLTAAFWGVKAAAAAAARQAELVVKTLFLPLLAVPVLSEILEVLAIMEQPLPLLV